MPGTNSSLKRAVCRHAPQRADSTPQQDTRHGLMVDSAAVASHAGRRPSEPVREQLGLGHHLELVDSVARLPTAAPSLAAGCSAASAAAGSDSTISVASSGPAAGEASGSVAATGEGPPPAPAAASRNGGTAALGDIPLT